MKESEARLFLPPRYAARDNPEYFVDRIEELRGVVHQPDVYPYAAALAQRVGAGWLVDIGCGRAGKLLPFRGQFDLLGIDYGENIRWCMEHHADVEWLDWDLESSEPLPLPDRIARNAVVICSDVIEHLLDPLPLVRNIASLVQRSPAVVVSTPDRVQLRGLGDLGPPRNPAHVREWSLLELEELFTAHGVAPARTGLTRSNDRDPPKRTILLTFGRGLSPPARPAPAEFSVLAIVRARNYANFAESVVTSLSNQGIQVHLMDDDGPSTFEDRVREVAAESGADWTILQRANEIRRAPWPGVTLRDGIWAVDRAGYTAVAHTVVDLRPSHFEFGEPTDLEQPSTWKRAVAQDRQVYPFNFTSLRFPVGGSTAGQETDRTSDAEHLHTYDETTFERDYVTELVAGVNAWPTAG